MAQANDNTTACPSVTVVVRHTIDRDKLEGLLISAFEGGSNYWIKELRCRDEGADVYEAPFSRGIYVVVLPERGDPNSDREFFLGPTSMRRGMQLMADKYPRHMADVISRNDDATTADVWLQLCLFGEVVYG